MYRVEYSRKHYLKIKGKWESGHKWHQILKSYCNLKQNEMMNYKAKDLQEEILSLIYFISISERTFLIFFYIPPCEIFSCTLGYKIVAQEELEGSTVLLCICSPSNLPFSPALLSSCSSSHPSFSTFEIFE